MLHRALRIVLSFVCVALIGSFTNVNGQSVADTPVTDTPTEGIEVTEAIEQETAGEEIQGEVQNGGEKVETTAPVFHPIAILPFKEKGENLAGIGKQIPDLLFANLAASPQLMLVDREDLNKVMEEQKLNLTGLVNPQEQVMLGQFTGAKLLITGSVLEVSDSIHLIAKIIGTETTRVSGVSVSGKMSDDLGDLAKALAAKVVDQIDERGSDLVAKPVDKKDAIATLKQKLGDGPKPLVKISVKEEHLNAKVVDPAVETELISTLIALGFEVVGSGQSDDDPDFLIEGEAFSEFATRVQDLVSVKARVELKVTNLKTSKVIAAGRQTELAVDLSENVAGKTALQNAAFDLVGRLIPKLLEKDE